MSTVFRVKLRFVISKHGFNNEPYLSVSVIDLASITIAEDAEYGLSQPFSLQDYVGYVDLIEGCEYTKEHVDAANSVLKPSDLDDLDDSKEYEGDAFVLIEAETWSPWIDSGVSEIDYNVIIQFKSFEEKGLVTDGLCAYQPPVLFEYSTNNDGDYLKIRKLDRERLLVEVGHCCVMRRMIIHRASLTRLLFEYSFE